MLKTKNMILRLTPDLNTQIHQAYIKFLQVNNLENSDKIVSKSEFIRTILNKCTKSDFIISIDKDLNV